MTGPMRSGVAAFAAVLLILLASSRAATAQTPPVSGQGTALQATVSGPFGSTTTALGSTGSLVDDADARTSALPAGSIASLGGANVLHATTISSIDGWNPGQEVASAASLVDLAVTVAGSAISAGFVMAEAGAPVGGEATGRSRVEGLAVDGVPMVPSGEENQTISLPVLTLILNEVQRTETGITVNALRITSLDGLVDVVVASATAGVDQ
jgi:hypothetical protein